MGAYHFLKVDWLRCKMQFKLLLVMSVFAVFMSFYSRNTVLPNAYLMFVAVIFSSQLFALEETSEAGFINMLPGTKFQKVMGRYMLMLMLLLSSAGIAAVILCCYYVVYGKLLPYSISFYIALFGVALIVCSLQNILFYTIGKGKSQQVAIIIRTLPGFVVFFLTGSIIEYIQKHPEVDVTWILENDILASTILILVAGITFVGGILVSSTIVKKKDFE